MLLYTRVVRPRARLKTSTQSTHDFVYRFKFCLQVAGSQVDATPEDYIVL